MASRIRSAAFVGRSRNPLSRGAIALGVKAGRKCLRSAGVNPSDVGLLIFCGIYRDENIGEPAIASLVQAKLGMNLLGRDGRGTFAFDVLNSGCGMMTAIHVADNHLRAQPSDHALIIAADSVPIKGYTEGFPFQSAGGAILLERSKGEKGIIDFRFDTYATEREVFRSYIEFSDGRDRKVRKGQYLRFEEDPKFLDKAVPGSVVTVRKLLARNSVTPRGVDLMLPSQVPIGFPQALAKELGTEGRTVDLGSTLGKVHTAGLAACIESILVDGALPRDRTVLLVNVGSGISVAAALMRT